MIQLLESENPQMSEQIPEHLDELPSPQYYTTDTIQKLIILRDTEK